MKVLVKKEEMAKPKPLVSVVLPFYNAPFLKEAVDSIINQSFHDFELILIDNGSTDNSMEVAKTFLEHSKVSLVQEPRRGVAYAANKGIELARGAYIARMDSDDLSYVNRLKLQVERLNQDQSVSVVSGLVDYLGPNENEGFIHYVNWLNTIKSVEDINLNQFVEFPLANPTLMIRKDIFRKFGMYEDGDFPEDYEFFLRMQANGIRMEKIDKSVLIWRDTAGRLTRTNDRYSQDALFRIKAKYLVKWLAINNPFYPEVYIWGAGRLSRRRSNYLLQEDVKVIKYIDFKETDQILHYESIPDAKKAFIVSYVANRGAREEIRLFLNQKGYKEGYNFILAS